MKEIYSFTLTQKPIKETDKEVSYKIILKSPSREEREEMEIENAAQFGKLTARGILTKDMLLNKYKDMADGVFSQKEVSSLIRLYLDCKEIENDLVKLTALTENVDEKAKEELEKKLFSKKRQIQVLEQQHNDVLDMTAENIARRKTIEWCQFALTYVSVDGSDKKLLFEGDTREEKLRWLDKQEELGENYVIKHGSQKITLFWYLWSIGAAQKPEDFKKYEDDGKKEVEITKEVEKTEEKPANSEVK